MKIYNTLFCGALLLGAAALTGCSDNDFFDVLGNKHNLVYVDQAASKVTECTLYRTPVGVFGDAEADVRVRLQYAIGDSLTVTAAADTSLVSKFNEENNTRYASVPDNVLKALVVTPTGISKGGNSSVANLKVSIPESARASLTAKDYVLPVRLKIAGGGEQSERPLAASDDMGYAYLVVHTTSDIAQFTGTAKKECAIVHSPVGTFGEVSGTFDVELAHAIGADMTLSAEVDNSLVDAYNSTNATSYTTLPDDVAKSLVIKGGTVKAGETSGSVEVSVDAEKAKSLKGAGYVIPLRLVMDYGNGSKVTADKSVAYIVVTTKESLINSEPTAMLGTGAESCDGWECVSAEGFNPDDMTFDGWNFSGTNLSKASFTVDLKKVRKVSAFNADSELMQTSTSFRVYLSTDNKTWTDLGDPTGNKTFRDSNWMRWYVLYGGIPARYVKFDIALDSESEYWEYADWGYCTLAWGLAFTE